MTTLDSALSLRRLGLCVIPVIANDKFPVIDKWQELRITAEQIPDYFRDGHNIGVHMGEPSKGVVDVDLDHPMAVAYADECLPTTGSIFGRTSKPRSHWLYLCPGAKTRKWQLPAAFAKHCGCAAMVAELRASGSQTVFPGSVHPSGEEIRWDVYTAPAKIAYDELCAQLQALYERVYEALMLAHPGWEPPAPKPAVVGGGVRPITTSGDRYALAALKKECDIVAGCADGTGNDTVFTAGLKMGGLIAAGVLDENEVYRCLTDALSGWTWREPRDKDRMLRSMRGGVEAGKSKPRQLPERSENETHNGVRDIRMAGRNGGESHRDRYLPVAPRDRLADVVAGDESVRTTDGREDPGSARLAPPDLRDRPPLPGTPVGGGSGGGGVGGGKDWQEGDPTPLGQVDPATGKIVLSPKRTVPTAEAFIRNHHAHQDGRTLHSFAGVLWGWSGNRWVEVEDERVHGVLHRWLDKAVRMVERKGIFTAVPYEANPQTFKQAMEAIRVEVHIPNTTKAPSWVGTKTFDYPASEILPCATRSVHIPTGTVLPATPALFNFNALEFDHDFFAPEPTLWLNFLNQVFGSDTQSIELLQDWFGYCLTGDTRQQKMLLLVGAPRSGKGTVARVLTQLVGEGNVASPSTSSLGTTFGLQPLVGRSLAIMGDARFSGPNVSVIVENLLRVSGEDSVNIERKFLPSITLKLPTRFVIMSNVMPQFSDASSAIAKRFVILNFSRTFINQEDQNLTEKLIAELPSILNWAIEGWKRLRARGRFIMPASSAFMAEEIENLGSPVRGFIADWCETGPDHSVELKTLYESFTNWCRTEGREHVFDRTKFAANVIAQVPTAVQRRTAGGVAKLFGIRVRESTNHQPEYEQIPEF